MSFIRMRGWLEDAGTGVDSYWSTQIDSEEPDESKDSWSYRTVELKLADCNDNINLSFGYGTEKVRKEMLLKLYRLREPLDIIERALREGETTE